METIKAKTVFCSQILLLSPGIVAGIVLPQPGGQAFFSCRFRFEKTVFMLSLKRGFCCNKDLKLGFNRTKHDTSVLAVTVAVRLEFDTRTLSPKKSPDLRMATFFFLNKSFFTEISTRPSWTIKNKFADSPWFTSVVPALKSKLLI